MTFGWVSTSTPAPAPILAAWGLQQHSIIKDLLAAVLVSPFHLPWSHHPQAAKKEEARKRGKADFYTTDPKFDERFQLGYNMKGDAVRVAASGPLLGCVGPCLCASVL